MLISHSALLRDRYLELSARICTQLPSSLEALRTVQSIRLSDLVFHGEKIFTVSSSIPNARLQVPQATIDTASASIPDLSTFKSSFRQDGQYSIAYHSIT
jgi:hypothetical protein